MQVALTNGAVGVIHASRMASGHLNDLRLRIFGTKGGLVVRFEQEQTLLSASLGADMMQGRWVDIDVPQVATNYERFIAAIREGASVAPDFARGAGLQAVLDRAVQSDARGGLALPV